MRHPSPDALVELHFEETTRGDRVSIEAHLRACSECVAFLSDLRGLEQALGPGPQDEPPSDGLARVLARVAEVRPTPRRRAEWAAAVIPCAGAMLAGGWAIRTAGERLNTLGVVAAEASGPVPAELLGLSLAALGLVALGALLTLALAPVLILESRRS